MTMAVGFVYSIEGAHALIQQTLADAVPTSRRVRLHARIGEALEELYGDNAEAHAAQLAHHFAEAQTSTGLGLYGYQVRWVTDETTGKPTSANREVVEEEGAIVRQVFEHFCGGNSVYEIAKRLNQQGIPTKGGNKWHPLGIKRMLANEAYMGVTYYGKERVEKLKNQKQRRRTAVEAEAWIEVPGYTPAIISEEVFQRVQKRLKEPAIRLGRPTEPYLLTGHIFCGHCGTPLVGTTLNKKYRYYRCRGAWATAVRERTCGAKYIQRDKLNDAVWGTVVQVLENPDIVLAELRRLRASEPSTLADEIERLRAEIRHLDDQGKRFVKLFALGEVDEPWIKAHSGPVKLMLDNYRAEL